jgi:hypothetical protein
LIYFLKNEEVNDYFKAKDLDKAKEVLDYLKCSVEERGEYEYYKESLHYQASMYESTYVIEMMKGKKRTLEIAKALKAQEVAVEVIMATTGLAQAEIESLPLN